jgi:hypothetical protein
MSPVGFSLQIRGILIPLVVGAFLTGERFDRLSILSAVWLVSVAVNLGSRVPLADSARVIKVENLPRMIVSIYGRLIG